MPPRGWSASPWAPRPRVSKAAYPRSGRTVSEETTHLAATIGEKIGLRRAGILSVDKGVIATYVHGALAPGVGRIGVAVAIESDGDSAKLTEFGKQVAMHVAATSPKALATGDLDAGEVARERAVLSEQARESGKPENIIEKMVEGRLRKFYEEVVLLEQTFVIDNEMNVAAAAEAAAKDIGAPVRIAWSITLVIFPAATCDSEPPSTVKSWAYAKTFRPSMVP